MAHLGCNARYSLRKSSMIDGNSLKTVLCHLENVRKKLKCHKQTQIVRILLELGLFNSEEFMD